MSRSLIKPRPLFKPMLASSVTDYDKLRYPLLASPKYDGIRASVQNGVLYSRSLKLIPSKQLQAYFGVPELEGVDGELIAGSPTEPGCFQRTTSAVMTRDTLTRKPGTFSSKEVSLYVFDQLAGEWEGARFQTRWLNSVNWLSCFSYLSRVVVVEQEIVVSREALDKVVARHSAEGYEGTMLRDPSGLYKQGRSTEREGGLLRIKPFEDAEAIIVDTYEQQENTNPQETNELGRSKRSSAKAGKVGKGTLGGFEVVTKQYADLWIGSPFPQEARFRIGTGVGLTDALRKELWKKRKSLVGKIIKYRYQKVGTKDAPRIPIFLGFRDGRDL